MPLHTCDFPYEEIRLPSGDYFPSWQAARDAGYQDNQIWSVCEDNGSYSYGPPHHIVNVLGFIATKETHDFETYYDEEAEPNEVQHALDTAEGAFAVNPNITSAGRYLAAAMDAEADGTINDEEFLDHLASIRDWLQA